ncbi:MAG: AraC family transcriptional regulator ligand-binding domain-containing protein [Marinobacter sp.]|uniref:AraC family transcriptional regulator n=1 Tax=Marinobacter sp. TaxID=50741 RepID=UPI00299F2F1B|nr:AraC family transcriptional regulator ligand-binding domain-containing protein [Marinobacter sp.]MDX1755096.1 AraC family transcriptional regulator ligand-binding domain-containing protein [Marinobacter sp.]
MNYPLLSSCYFNHFLRYGGEQGVDLNGDLTPYDIGSGESSTTFTELQHLIRRLLKSGCPPYMGLEVGADIKVSSHGTLGFALSNAKNLDQCLDFLCNYYRTRAQILDIEYQKGERDAFIVVRPDVEWGDVELVTYETIMALLYNILSFAIGKKVQRCVLEFPYRKPAWEVLYHKHLPGSHVFGSPHARIRIPLELVAMPCVASDPVFANVAIGQLDLQLSQILQQQPLSTKIKKLVEKTGNYGLSLEEAANALFLSKSTLIRKLNMEGQTFRALIEGLKKNQAAYLLTKTTYKLEVVSVKLGYDEVANFNRAFKRWFRCTPGRFRDNGRRGAD